jgi:hypothetical protein
MNLQKHKNNVFIAISNTAMKHDAMTYDTIATKIAGAAQSRADSEAALKDGSTRIPRRSMNTANIIDDMAIKHLPRKNKKSPTLSTAKSLHDCQF